MKNHIKINVIVYFDLEVNMKDKRCLFIGHRNAPESIYTNIISIIEN